VGILPEDAVSDPRTHRRFRHGCRTRTAAEIEALDQLSRIRALTLEESLRLEDAINRERDLRRKEMQARKMPVKKSKKQFGDNALVGA
jgi:hypothetical protein